VRGDFFSNAHARNNLIFSLYSKIFDRLSHHFQSRPAPEIIMTPSRGGRRIALTPIPVAVAGMDRLTREILLGRALWYF